MGDQAFMTIITPQVASKRMGKPYLDAVSQRFERGWVLSGIAINRSALMSRFQDALL